MKQFIDLERFSQIRYFLVWYSNWVIGYSKKLNNICFWSPAQQIKIIVP
jgi:hypothetical protein